MFHKDVCMRCLWCQMFQRREAADRPGYQAVIPRVGWCRGVRDRGLSGRWSQQANTEARAWALGSAAEIAIKDSLPETMSWWHAHRAQSASRTAALAAGGYDRPLARLAGLRRRSPGKVAAAVRTTQRPVNLRFRVDLVRAQFGVRSEGGSSRRGAHSAATASSTPIGGAGSASMRKYAMVCRSPSFSPTTGSHPSNVRARVMSGQR